MSAARWPLGCALLACAGRVAVTEPTVVGEERQRPPRLSAGLPEGEVALDEAEIRWERDAHDDFDATFEIAVLANRGRPGRDADALMVRALGRAVELSGCDPERLGNVRLLAIAVLGTPDHPAELDRELARLADVGPVECRALSTVR